MLICLPLQRNYKARLTIDRLSKTLFSRLNEGSDPLFIMSGKGFWSNHAY